MDKYYFVVKDKLLSNNRKSIISSDNLKELQECYDFICNARLGGYNITYISHIKERR